MPTFLTIYQSADNTAKSKIIKDITDGCDMADSTFFTKRSRLESGDKQAFNKLEREWIARYFNDDVENLFPELEPTTKY